MASAASAALMELLHSKHSDICLWHAQWVPSFQLLCWGHCGPAAPSSRLTGDARRCHCQAGSDACGGPSVIPYLFLRSVGWALLVPWPVSPRLRDAYVSCSALHFSYPSCQPPYYGSGPPDVSLDRFSCWQFSSEASAAISYSGTRCPMVGGTEGARAAWLTLHGLGLDQSSQPPALSYLLIGSSCSDLVTLHPLRSPLSSSVTQAQKLHRNRGLLVPRMAVCPSWTGATWQLHLIPKRQLSSETARLYPGRLEMEKFAQTFIISCPRQGP